MEAKTGESNITINIEDGKQVYPCRCGETHRGDYGAYDYYHHNCFHEGRLWGSLVEENVIQAICPDCGMSWIVEVEAEI